MAKQLAPSGPMSHLYRDGEVRALINELLRDAHTIDAIRARVAAQFGDARTPSRSAIGRYARKARLRLGIDFTIVG